MLSYVVFVCYVFFIKQKTAYEMRISDWSSDVCSSDLFMLARHVDSRRRLRRRFPPTRPQRAGRRVSRAAPGIGRRRRERQGYQPHRPRRGSRRSARTRAPDRRRGGRRSILHPSPDAVAARKRRFRRPDASRQHIRYPRVRSRDARQRRIVAARRAHLPPFGRLEPASYPPGPPPVGGLRSPALSRPWHLLLPTRERLPR